MRSSTEHHNQTQGGKGDELKKRLIKKKVKDMSDYEICEHLVYGIGYWELFAEKEFDKRIWSKKLPEYITDSKHKEG
jgi:hypothetical protein